MRIYTKWFSKCHEDSVLNCAHSFTLQNNLSVLVMILMKMKMSLVVE